AVLTGARSALPINLRGTGPAATLTAMSKTLVIAEKPSVGRDLARVLDGPFEKGEGYLEGPQHLITWAVGHLVQLAEPDEYDPKYKRWRMDDLPIVPEQFKLVVRDERSRKQMSVVSRQLARADVQEVVNACDAGREGELIFAYLYEKARARKPVRRLWLNSMTSAAMKDASSRARAQRASCADPASPASSRRSRSSAPAAGVPRRARRSCRVSGRSGRSRSSRRESSASARRCCMTSPRCSARRT